MSRTRKYTCGQITPSGCILFTGDYPSFIDEDSLDCDLNLDELLKVYGEKVEDILASLDFTSLDKECYSFDPDTVTSAGLHQQHISKVCVLESAVDALQTSLSSLNIGTYTLTIDLDCLTPAASPCAQGTNVYSLISLIQLFKAEICAIKDHLNL